MNREYATVYSPTLERPIEMLIFGHSGKPILVFPPSEGRFFDYESFGMIAEIEPFIRDGKVQVFCVDSLDKESWYAFVPAPEKAYHANRYDAAIIQDVVPFIKERSGHDSGILTHGCSFGGYHAVNFYLRHPDIFDSCIALSGNYSIQFTVSGYCDGDVYFHDPLLYLPNLNDPWFLGHLREDLLIICCGQGAWEDWLGEAHSLSHFLYEKGIPHLFDLWGQDVSHDWPWWKKQITYFLGQLDHAGYLCRNHRFNRHDVGRFLAGFPNFT